MKVKEYREEDGEEEKEDGKGGESKEKDKMTEVRVPSFYRSFSFLSLNCYE